MSIDLSQFDQQWSQTSPAAADALERLPDGTYQVIVEQIEATQTKTGNRPCILWTLKVTGPRHAGRKIWHRDYLDKPETFPFLHRNLGLFGIRLGKISELPGHYPTLMGKAVEIALRTRNGFQGCYFNRFLPRQLADPSSAPTNPAHPTGNADPGIASLSPF